MQGVSKSSPDEYGVTFASESFGSIYMVEAEMVIWAADDVRKHVL